MTTENPVSLASSLSSESSTLTLRSPKRERQSSPFLSPSIFIPISSVQNEQGISSSTTTEHKKDSNCTKSLTIENLAKLNNKKEKQQTCFVCYKTILLSEDSWRDVYSDFTSTSFLQLSELITQIMKETKTNVKWKSFKDALVCMTCFSLLDLVDELQEQLKSMKKELGGVKLQIQNKVAESLIKKVEKVKDEDVKLESIESEVGCSKVEVPAEEPEVIVTVYDNKSCTYSEEMEISLSEEDNSIDEDFTLNSPKKKKSKKKQLKSKNLAKNKLTMGKKTNSLKNEKKNELMPKNIYKCKFQKCYYSAPNEKKLLLHIQKKHESNNVEQVNDGGNKGKKNYHSCDDCTAQFRNSSTLQRHIETVHLGLKPYLCDYCSSAFKNRSNLHSHINIVHRQIKPYLCDTCPYSTSKRAALVNHIESVHKNSKPFLCDLCTFATGYKEKLTRHINTVHKKEKPFHCEVCSYKAARRDYMRDHMKRVHKLILN